MPEQQPQENNQAPTWADFKPPVLTTPFGNGQMMNPGLTIPEPAAQPVTPSPLAPVAPPPAPATPTAEPPATLIPDPTPPLPASPTPEAVLTPDPAPSSPPPTVTPSPPTLPGHEFPVKKIIISLVVLIVLGGLGGGAYWAIANNLITVPNFSGSSTAAPTLTENTDILSSAVGPASWENNFSTDLLASEKGGLEFQVTDPPAASASATPSAAQSQASRSAGLVAPTDLRSLLIKIAKIEVHLATQNIVGSATVSTASQSSTKAVDHWETLRLSGTGSIDLLALRNQGGGLSSLGVTYLATGRYTEVRLYLTGAAAVSSSGQTLTVSIPGNTGLVKLVRSFDVSATGTKSLIVDFDASRMLEKVGDSYQLKPVVGRVLFDGKSI